MVFYHMRTEVHKIIEAIGTSITRDFDEATLLLADVCINAMWCHVKNRDIVLHGCHILADIQNQVSNARAHIGQQLPLVNNWFMLANIQTKTSTECAFTTRQVPVLTDALYHHMSDVATVSALLRFVDRINAQHIFFGHTGLPDCSAEICGKFSAALADVMQYHMHATEWVDAQADVVCYRQDKPAGYRQNKPVVHIACGIMQQLWKNKHGEYYASTGFAKSVDALAKTTQLHRGCTIQRCSVDAVASLLLGRSVQCPEIHKKVAHSIQMSGLTPTVCDTKAHSQDRLERTTTEVATTGGSGAIFVGVSGDNACELRRDCNESMMMMQMQRGGVVPEKRVTTDDCTTTLSYRKLTVRDMTGADTTILENHSDIVFEKASLCLLSSNRVFDIEYAVIEQVTYLKSLQRYNDNSDEFANIFGFGRFCHGFVQGKIMVVRPSSF